MFFGQTFSPVDLGTIGLLVVLEGLLSVDNALILGLLARRVHPDKRAKALSYGLIGAVVFRLLAVTAASFLLRFTLLKLLGGLYLLGISVRHLVFVRKTPEKAMVTVGGDSRSICPEDPPPEVITERHGRLQFWWSVLGIELADLAFGVDNILAAVALIGPPPHGTPRDALHPKLWVIITGGMIGVIMMRFAAAACVKILKRYPHFDKSAYLIISIVAFKMILEWAYSGLDFQSPRAVPFWAFWIALIGCLAIGFLPDRRRRTQGGG